MSFSLPVVVDINHPPPDIVSVFVPSVAMSIVRFASISIAKELGYEVYDFWVSIFLHAGKALI